MNKKVIIISICIVILIMGVICYFVFTGNRRKNTNNNVLLDEQEENNIENSNIQEKNSVEEDNNISKIAVVYFSATGNTKKVAQYIGEETKGDMIEIIPKEKYTSEDLSYNNDCRANREQQDKDARPEISNKIDITKYDTIFLGYPIWWGDVPKIILTFIDNNNLNGKTVIPFCTSGGTGISQSQDTLKSYNKSMDLKDGKRFSSSIDQEEISSWVKELGLK